MRVERQCTWSITCSCATKTKLAKREDAAAADSFVCALKYKSNVRVCGFSVFCAENVSKA